LAVLSTSCAEAPVAGQAPEPRPVLASEIGLASFYGTRLHGEETASGEILDRRELVAAHPTYPFDTVVRVTNLENGRSVEVRIIDRGPGRSARAEGVIIDLSTGAAKILGFIREGRTKVRLEVLRWGEKH
jgi:rare lipoprotein A